MFGCSCSPLGFSVLNGTKMQNVYIMDLSFMFYRSYCVKCKFPPMFRALVESILDHKNLNFPQIATGRVFNSVTRDALEKGWQMGLHTAVFAPLCVLRILRNGGKKTSQYCAQDKS